MIFSELWCLSGPFAFDEAISPDLRHSVTHTHALIPSASRSTLVLISSSGLPHLSSEIYGCAPYRGFRGEAITKSFGRPRPEWTISTSLSLSLNHEKPKSRSPLQ